MDFLTISLALIVGVWIIYLFGTRNYGYFEKLGIPYVQPVPIFGNMSRFLMKTKSLHLILQELYESNPDAKYFGFYDFGTPIILLKDPELVKSITIKNADSFPDHQMLAVAVSEPLFQKSLFSLKGEEWREMRTVLTPSFTSSKMKIMFEILRKCAVDFADHLAERNPQPEAIDMRDVFRRYTLDVIASAAFGLSVDSMKDPDNDFYRMGKSVGDFGGIKMVKFFCMKNAPWLAKRLGLKFTDDETSGYFINVIANAIATRKEQGIVRPDMIHLLMQATDGEGKSDISIEEIAAQAFIFLLGGLGAPTTTMSYVAHLLAVNRDMQRRLQAEIDQVLEKCSGEVSYDDLHAMKYLDAVVNETLRMYPPDGFIDRIGPTSFTLPPPLPGGEPVRIGPGQNFLIPIYSFHHDERYFPNPEKFDPERFNEDNKSAISPQTYFPFGLGPRMCLARRFALMTVKLAMFHVLAKCNILPSSTTESPVTLSGETFEMIPRAGFWLKIEPRKQTNLL